MDGSNALKENSPERRPVIKAQRIDIRWNEDMPVFAKEEFLRAVGDEYGWLGGFDEAGQLRCILPYTILRKAGFRLVRFRTQTIPCCDELSVLEEKSFLNSVVDYFKAARADVIVPPSNNAVFRTYPDGADAAPYGTYVIDLCKPEVELWKNISHGTRESIKRAKRDGVRLHEGIEFLGEAYELVRLTFSRSKMHFMPFAKFQRFVEGLGDNGRLTALEFGGVLVSCCLCAFSKWSAYAVYVGNASQSRGPSSKTLYWDAICTFCRAGVKKFDFYGARIDPEKGSKQEGINLSKSLFGANLTRGFLWKYPLRPLRARAYSISVRLMLGGDLVDQERHKLALFHKGFSGH